MPVVAAEVVVVLEVATAPVAAVTVVAARGMAASARMASATGPAVGVRTATACVATPRNSPRVTPLF